MPFTPEEIANKRFVVALRGYDRDEVDSFLKEVGDEVGSLLRRVEGRSGAVAADVDVFGQFGAQIESIARSAVAAAEDIRVQAEHRAADILSAARREVQQLRDAAVRDLAGVREQWDQERQDLLKVEAEIRQEQEREIEVQKATISNALVEAEKLREVAGAQAKAIHDGLEARAAEIRSAEAKAEAMRESARRELAAAEAIKVRAGAEAAAMVARAEDEIKHQRREMLNRLQQSLRGLAGSDDQIPVPVEPVPVIALTDRESDPKGPHEGK
jgi:DivIVA domain-containing protein